MGVRGAGGREYPVSVDFADLACALGRLEWGHEDGIRLKMVADLWIASCTLEEIGGKLARPATRETASRLLNAAFRWVCSADGGGFTEPGALGLSPGSMSQDATNAASIKAKTSPDFALRHLVT